MAKTAPPDSDGVIDVFVEIPAGSRNKYEWDPDLGAMRLDRRLFSAMVYPADYGFVPETLGEDGDELDALVILDEPTFPGCVVRARVVGVFHMTDDKGPDAKLLCVLADDSRNGHICDLEDIPEHLRQEVSHFFDVYKDLEPGKSSDVRGFGNRDDALAELEAARKRYVPPSAG